MADRTTANPACECGADAWRTSATMIWCFACGRLWGRVNGSWVLDPDTVPGATTTREPGCRCHQEVGDSPCPVHPSEEP